MLLHSDITPTLWGSLCSYSTKRVWFYIRQTTMTIELSIGLLQYTSCYQALTLGVFLSIFMATSVNFSFPL